MNSLWKEVKLTFTAAVYARRLYGLFLGVVPLYWIQFKCVKVDGEPFTMTNRLIVLIWFLLWVIAAHIVMGRYPWWVTIPYGFMLGTMMATISRWLRETNGQGPNPPQ